MLIRPGDHAAALAVAPGIDPSVAKPTARSDSMSRRIRPPTELGLERWTTQSCRPPAAPNSFDTDDGP